LLGIEVLGNEASSAPTAVAPYFGVGDERTGFLWLDGLYILSLAEAFQF
jgi:hypothetical protein